MSTIASVTITEDARSRVMKNALVAPTARPKQQADADEHRLRAGRIAACQDVADGHRDAAEREIERQKPDAQRLADDRDAERRRLTQDQQQQKRLQQRSAAPGGADRRSAVP